MPTYEYVCRDCGEYLEVVQSFRDDSLETCPACGGNLRKMFGNIGIVLKGSGFYRTDSRGTSSSTSSTSVNGSDGSKSASESSGSTSSSSSSDSSSSSSTSSDSKSSTPAVKAAG